MFFCDTARTDIYTLPPRHTLALSHTHTHTHTHYSGYPLYQTHTPVVRYAGSTELDHGMEDVHVAADLIDLSPPPREAPRPAQQTRHSDPPLPVSGLTRCVRGTGRLHTRTHTRTHTHTHTHII